MDQASMFVLGTNHRLQGSPGYRRSVEDPDYTHCLEAIIADESVDFVFEEASGCGRTKADYLARTLGIRYLDVDPHRLVAHEFGIVDKDGKPFPDDITLEQQVEEQALREELWCKRILEQGFKSGLLICGHNHSLSMTFRLRSAGLKLKYNTYLPIEKLCTRRHCD